MSEQQLKIVITADAAGVVPSVNNVTNSLNKLKGSSQQSTQALINLSRVAQDAPYGFIGIANNINPLLESLQRLRASSGSTGGALRALGSSLLGAGGLGLAVGVVSSLLVVFGDRLTGSGKNAKSASLGLKIYSDELAKLSSEAGASGIANITKLSAALSDSTIPLQQRAAALQEYNKVADKSNQLQLSDLTNIEKVNSAIGDQINLLKTRALIKGAEEQIANLFKTVLANEFKISNAADKLNKTFDLSQLVSQGNDVQGFTRKVDALQKSSQVLGKQQTFFSQSQIDAAQQKIGDLFNFIQRKIKEGAGFGSVLDLTKDPKDPKGKEIKITPRLRFDPDRFIEPNQELQTFKGIEDQIKRNLERQPIKAPIKLEFPQFDPKQVQKFLDMRHNMEQLAKTVSGVVVPAFEKMFDAIKSGENPIKAFFKSIGESVLDLIKKLIAAAIQAAVLSLVTGGVSGGGVGFLTAFKGITGIAGGGGNINVARGSNFGQVAGLGLGGQTFNVNVTGEIAARGNTMQLVLSRNAKAVRRNG